MLKKIIIAVFFTVFFLLRLYPAAGDVKLKLPVRVISQNAQNIHTVYVKGLAKANFQLLINGTPRALAGVHPKSCSIDSVKSGRRFALSFDIPAYDINLERTVTRFVQEILSPGDQLVFRSPLSIYRIDVTAAKADIIAYIKTQLEKDTRQYKQDRDENLAQMVRLMENLEPKLDKKKAGIRWVSLFTGHFVNQWNNYYANYLVHHLEQFSEVTQQLAQNEGTGTEKWLIHFQGNDDGSGLATVSGQFQRVNRKIDAFLAKLPKSLAQQAAVVRESLGKVKAAMSRETGETSAGLIDVLLGVNVRFNVIFRSASGDAGAQLIAGYQQFLEEMARKTGGISVKTADPAAALDTVSSHEDVYYDLIYDFDGQAVDKGMVVRLLDAPTGAAAFHKTKFKKEEFTWLMAYVNQQVAALDIADFSLKSRALSFNVNGFRMQAGRGKAKSGMVRLDIRLINDAQETVYETGKTLQSTDPSISVSLNIPARHSGYFKLSIVARDMISGQTKELKKYVKIK